MHGSTDTLRLIERYCARDDLRTWDPYDVWKTKAGFDVRVLFNRNRRAGLVPAAVLTLLDLYPNNGLRIGYGRQEYPVVRALAALALMNAERLGDRWARPHALRHLEWLQDNPSAGYSGPCWGIGFRQSIQKDLVYEAELPLSTMTPYALEAFVDWTALTGDTRFLRTIRGIHEFFTRDLVVLEETPEYLVTSYGALADRKVINAQTYHMLALALVLPHLDELAAARARLRIGKLYRYVVMNQQADGSWLYSPEGDSFIDCFHSCIVLKNLVKTDRVVPLPGCEAVVRRGYAYLRGNFLVPGRDLVKRFTLANKPSLVRFDLYDNAEMLNLAVLLGDLELAGDLARAIERTFVTPGGIFSQVDRFGLRRNRDMLRWAVLPYLCARSALELALRSGRAPRPAAARAVVH